MCAIIDANVAGKVFGHNPIPAGKKFFDWIDEGSGRLICAGKLKEELEDSSPGFREWARVALNTGKMKNINKEEVETRTEQIREESIHSSNDPHILALAQVSGARLLYSNDKKLHEDFRNRDLISPAGSIYSTLKGENFTRAHRNLLGRSDLCPLVQ